MVLKRGRLPNAHKKSFSMSRKSPLLFVNFSFINRIKSGLDWLVNVTTQNYEFCTAEWRAFRGRRRFHGVRSWHALHVATLAGIYGGTFFSMYFTTLSDGQTAVRGKWRKMTIIRRGCTVGTVRAKTIVNASSQRWWKKVRKKSTR